MYYRQFERHDPPHAHTHTPLCPTPHMHTTHAPEEVLEVVPLTELRQLGVELGGDEHRAGEVRIGLHHDVSVKGEREGRRRRE
jgi:hypothetical protein